MAINDIGDGPVDRSVEPIVSESPNPYLKDGGGSKSEPFALNQQGLLFAPKFAPDSFRIVKKRNLNRQKNMCEGEDVSDSGAKNREVKIGGYMRASERLIFEDVIDSTEPFVLKTMGWNGEVRVERGEYRGPIGMGGEGGNLWKYRLKLVSTGKNEYDKFHGSSIVE